MAFPFAIVGFDLDGTLIDTSEDLTAAVNHALTDAGRPLLTRAEVEPMIGGGAKHMLRQALDASGGCDDGEFRRLYKLLLSYYGEHTADQSQPFPGAVAALDALAERGVRLGVVTNKFESFALTVLRELDLIGRFDTVIGGDTLGKGNEKPSAAPIHALIARLGGGRTAFVGDSSYDMLTARNAGLPAIAVSFGFKLHGGDPLEGDAMIDHFDQLIPTLEQL